MKLSKNTVETFKIINNFISSEDIRIKIKDGIISQFSGSDSSNMFIYSKLDENIPDMVIYDISKFIKAIDISTKKINDKFIYPELKLTENEDKVIIENEDNKQELMLGFDNLIDFEGEHKNIDKLKKDENKLEIDNYVNDINKKLSFIDSETIKFIFDSNNQLVKYVLEDNINNKSEKKIKKSSEGNKEYEFDIEFFKTLKKMKDYDIYNIFSENDDDEVCNLCFNKKIEEQELFIMINNKEDNLDM